MRNLVKQKKLVQILAISLALIFCLTFFVVFLGLFDKKAEALSDDLQGFSSSLREMQKKYQPSKDAGVQAVAFSAESDEETNQEVEESEFLTNRLIVYCDENLDDCGAVAKAEYQDIHIYQYQSAQEAEVAFDYFASLEEVTALSYDEVISAGDFQEEEIEDFGNTQSQAVSYKSWGAKYLGYSDFSTTLNAMTTQPEEVIVAVLDSGIYSDHELFKDRILHQYAQNFTTEVSETEYAYEDYNGHGTHVAGIIANATGDNVKILPMKVLDSDGNGLVSMIVEAIETIEKLVADHGVDIKLMNMSIGVKKATNSSGTSTSISPTLEKQIVSAYKKGILSIVSAGNDSELTSTTCPANVDCAITVSSLYLYTRTMPTKTEILYFDSSYSNYGAEVDFSAPGTSIYSAGRAAPNSYVYMSGTSMAAPHVTACYALVRSSPLYHDVSISELNLVMQNNAIDLGEVGKDNYYGYGCINVSGIGISTIGEVEFSRPESQCEEQFELTLSYDPALVPEGHNVKIYYTANEVAVSVDPSTDSEFSTAITINETTKVTAAAFVYTSQGLLVQRSLVTSKIYYFGNEDLLANYEVEKITEYKVNILKYNGELEELNVPDYIYGRKVVGIGARAFNSSKVKVLNLPTSISSIQENAFNSNSSLETIICYSANIVIGDSAFRGSLIKQIDLQGASEVGNYAFASCERLESLLLPYCQSLGAYAISGSALKYVLFGCDIAEIGSQTGLKIETVYGYKDTVAEDFAEIKDINFKDLTLRYSKTHPTRKVCAGEDGFSMTFEVMGLLYLNDCSFSFSGDADTLECLRTKVDDFSHTIEVNIAGVVANDYSLEFVFADIYGNQIESSCTIKVVPQGTEKFPLNFVGEGYEVYVDGELAVSGVELFKGCDYQIAIKAKNGYSLNSVMLDKDVKLNQITENTQFVLNNSAAESQTLSVVASQKETLVVQFDYNSENGVVKVNGQSTSSTLVIASENLSFEVVANEGYLVKSILIDGQEQSLSEDGIYLLSNVTTDKNIEIKFKEAYYHIDIVQGHGGTIVAPGLTQNIVKHGTTITLKLSASEGYKLGTVLVNDQVVETSNNLLVLENIGEDKNIVVQFEKSTSLWKDAALIRYFVVMLVVFVGFLIAKVTLYVIRKNRNKV